MHFMLLEKHFVTDLGMFFPAFRWSEGSLHGWFKASRLSEKRQSTCSYQYLCVGFENFAAAAFKSELWFGEVFLVLVLLFFIRLPKQKFPSWETSHLC